MYKYIYTHRNAQYTSALRCFTLFDAWPPYPFQLYLRTGTLLMECDNDGNVEIITLRSKVATGSVTGSPMKQSSRRFIMA